MSVTVNFKTASGLNSTRVFKQAEGISIYGKCTGVAGIGEPGTHVRLEIKKGSSVIYFQETMTNIWGDYDFYYTTPNYNGQLTVRLIATYSISGQDVVNIPIGVNVQPGNAPLPEVEMAWLSYLPAILIIGAGIYLFRELQK